LRSRFLEYEELKENAKPGREEAFSRIVEEGLKRDAPSQAILVAAKLTGRTDVPDPVPGASYPDLKLSVLFMDSVDAGEWIRSGGLPYFDSGAALRLSELAAESGKEEYARFALRYAERRSKGDPNTKKLNEAVLRLSIMLGLETDAEEIGI